MSAGPAGQGKPWPPRLRRLPIVLASALFAVLLVLAMMHLVVPAL